MLKKILLFMTVLVSTLAVAEQKNVGDYQIHYSVFNASFITPEVARAYSITRGKQRAVVNISVRKDLADGSNVPEHALVTGTTFDLIHRSELDFREIEEQGAVYYIAEFNFSDKELRSFDIKVQPDPNGPAYRIEFNQTFYADE